MNEQQKKQLGAKTVMGLGALVCGIVLPFIGGDPFLGGIGVGVGTMIFANAIGDARRFKESTSAVSPVIGVILMVAITVVLAAIVFILVTNLSQPVEQTPAISFTKGDGFLTVVQAPPEGISWMDIAVNGCETVPTEGNVTAGDVVTNCAGLVTVRHVPSNSLLFSAEFA